jgi:dTDP-4-amino-4,6-dideoxygalactose transaminase
VRCSSDRESVQSNLAAAGIETLVHYPLAITRQPAMAAWQPAACPEADRAASSVLSLPLYPSMHDTGVDEITGALCAS